MISVIAFVVLAFLLTVGETKKSNDQIADCIKNTLAADIANYNVTYGKLRSTKIVRIKQALQNILKENGSVKTAPNGQMTIDESKYAAYCDKMKNTKSGKAMNACKNKPDAKEMYKEAARLPQCVFLELKEKDCK